MAFDPLSASTRKFRKGLLTFSTAYAFYLYYGFILEEIPYLKTQSGGIPENILEVVLVVSILYLLVSFYLYVTDDLNNPVERSYVINYNKEREKVYGSLKAEFQNNIINHTSIKTHKIQEELKRIIIESSIEFYGKNPDYDSADNNELKQFVKNKFKDWVGEENKDKHAKHVEFRPLLIDDVVTVLFREGRNIYNFSLMQKPKGEERVAKLRTFLDFYFPLVYASVILIVGGILYVKNLLN